MKVFNKVRRIYKVYCLVIRFLDVSLELYVCVGGGGNIFGRVGVWDSFWIGWNEGKVVFLWGREVNKFFYRKWVSCFIGVIVYVIVFESVVLKKKKNF